MKIIISPEHIDFLKENKFFLTPNGSFDRTWLTVGKPYDAQGKAYRVERYSAHYIGPCFSSMGAFSYSKSAFRDGVTIGRYCALAGGIQVMAKDHDYTRVGMSFFDHSHQAPYGAFEADRGVAFKKHPLQKHLHNLNLTIGDDVWIGAGVLFARNVTVGQGAVIATRSIVTRDVPPYAIVAGTPATIKKYRFDEKTIERLLASRWTDYAYTDFSGMEMSDPNRFLDQFEEATAAGRIQAYPREYVDIDAELIRIANEVESKQGKSPVSANQRVRKRRPFRAIYKKLFA